MLPALGKGDEWLGIVQVVEAVEDGGQAKAGVAVMVSDTEFETRREEASQTCTKFKRFPGMRRGSGRRVVLKGLDLGIARE